MAEAIARARFIPLAPRKVRLVADQIRGKKVDEARATLALPSPEDLARPLWLSRSHTPYAPSFTVDNATRQRISNTADTAVMCSASISSPREATHRPR